MQFGIFSELISGMVFNSINPVAEELILIPGFFQDCGAFFIFPGTVGEAFRSVYYGDGPVFTGVLFLYVDVFVKAVVMKRVIGVCFRVVIKVFHAFPAGFCQCDSKILGQDTVHVGARQLDYVH